MKIPMGGKTVTMTGADAYDVYRKATKQAPVPLDPRQGGAGETGAGTQSH